MKLDSEVLLCQNHPRYQEYKCVIGRIIFVMDANRVVVRLRHTEMWCYRHEIEEVSAHGPDGVGRTPEEVIKAYDEAHR